jgi:hypothetical protein
MESNHLSNPTAPMLITFKVSTSNSLSLRSLTSRVTNEELIYTHPGFFHFMDQILSVTRIEAR